MILENGKHVILKARAIGLTHWTEAVRKQVEFHSAAQQAFLPWWMTSKGPITDPARLLSAGSKQ